MRVSFRACIVRGVNTLGNSTQHWECVLRVDRLLTSSSLVPKFVWDFVQLKMM
jgi:hypothetical protein